MSKTVTMRKGDRFADIHDSPETIAQAQRDGYHLCTEEEAETREVFEKANGAKSSLPEQGSGIKLPLSKKMRKEITAKAVEAGLANEEEAAALTDEELAALLAESNPPAQGNE